MKQNRQIKCIEKKQTKQKKNKVKKKEKEKEKERITYIFYYIAYIFKLISILQKQDIIHQHNAIIMSTHDIGNGSVIQHSSTYIKSPQAFYLRCPLAYVPPFALATIDQQTGTFSPPPAGRTSSLLDYRIYLSLMCWVFILAPPLPKT